MPVHPFFDRNSRYRLATADSIWSDHGVTSVQRFFQESARRALLEDWQSQVPTTAQDFGYSDATNQAIFQTLSARAQAVPPERVAGLVVRHEAIAEVMYAAPNYAPAMLTFDLLDPNQIPEPDLVRFPMAPADSFTGFDTGNLEQSNEFAVMLSGLEQYRHTVLVLLTSVRLETLQKLLDPEQPLGANDARVVSLVTTLLSLNTLTNTARDPGKPSLASRVFDVLRLVPTLEGVSNRDGELRLKVSLGRDCPVAPPGSWLVACQGPSVAGM